MFKHSHLEMPLEQGVTRRRGGGGVVRNDTPTVGFEVTLDDPEFQINCPATRSSDIAAADQDCNAANGLGVN